MSYYYDNFFDDYSDHHEKLAKYQTQKARGVQSINWYKIFIEYGLDDIGSHKFSVWPHQTKFSLPRFARPCPSVPRHGFVESRLVKTKKEMAQIIAETKKQDPKGEVIFATKLSAKFSGVATHTGIVFGHGNDGATSGKSSVTIPAYVSNKIWRESIGTHPCDNAGIKKTGSGYVEFVENNGKIVFVQLRDGPVIPHATNYIPKQVKVAKVQLAEGDLLEWEKLVAGWKNIPGLVVWHPNGSLASHYSVHCMLHKIPIVLSSKAPKKGDILKPTSWQPAELGTNDLKTIAALLKKRFAVGYKGKLKQQSSICHTSVGVLHSHCQWGNEPHLLRLRAEGIAGILYFVAAGCLGEDRHWYANGPGRSGKEPNCALVKKGLPGGRRYVFSSVLVHKSTDIERWIRQAEQDFATKSWCRAYGGPKWRKASKECAKGFQMAHDFIKSPTKGKLKKLFEQYNRLVNVVHNGGGIILDRWIGGLAMDEAANSPGPTFINNFAADIVLGLE